MLYRQRPLGSPCTVLRCCNFGAYPALATSPGQVQPPSLQGDKYNPVRNSPAVPGLLIRVQIVKARVTVPVQNPTSFSCTVPKEIDFPRYKLKCTGEKVLLGGILHVESCFPLHFMLYRGNLDYFSDSTDPEPTFYINAI